MKNFWIIFVVALSVASFVLAAEVAIDSSIHTSLSSHNGSSPTVVFISDQVGYAFFRDSAGSCAYGKTTDGGGSWGAAVTVDAQTDCFKVAVWYDRWTPGDTTGTYIHITTMDAADLWYTRLNTSGDVLTTTVNASAANQGGGFAVGANIPSITKGTDGDVYMGAQDPGDSFVIKCATGADCASAVNWTEAGSNPFDLATDWLILMPLSSGNIMAIRWDLSADTVSSKVYNDAGNSWDGAWTTVDASAIEDGTYDAHFGATVKRSTGDIYLVYATDVVTFGTNDDVRAATYSSGSWTLKADVLTNDTKGITGAKISFDENTNEIYAVYTARTTSGTASTGNVYWKKSSDGMANWGVENGPVNTTAGDIYGARVNIMSDERIYATWDLASTDDLMGNTIVDLTPSDTTAPSDVSNLAVSSPTTSSLLISWTAPGDDAGSGTATTYDLRYSTSLITSGNFSSATAVSGEPSPSVAGSSESMTVSGLSANTTYYFALKTSDEVPNTSAISNVPSGATSAVADTTAPADVSNLATSNASNNSIDVSWTAPGDDNNSGTATTYDLRYSTSLITSGNFSSATAVSGEPSPSVAGSSESMTVTGLSPSTTYYFAIKTSDEVPNTSAISNVPSLSTTATPDTTAPATISDLTVSSPAASSLLISWTAPGDDAGSGTATTYDLRYSTSLITSGNFSSATAVSGEPAPSIAGSSESMTVSGLSADTTYYFAIKTSDEVPNTSAISNVPSGTTSATSDSTAPSDVSNLAVSGPTTSSLLISWTAPGDDAGSGTATTYDLRYSTSLITSGNFSSATAVSGEPSPSVAGSSESMTVSGLSADTTYYFAIKTSDEVPNTSAISNVPSGATSAETTSEIIIPSSTGAPGILPTEVLFSGKAYPGANIRFYRRSTLDEKFVNTYILDTSATADSAGNFTKKFLALLQGEYFFAVEAKDKDGRSSGVSGFTTNLASDNSLKADNLFVAPTVGFISSRVTKGKALAVVGYAFPGSTVKIQVDNALNYETIAKTSGLYGLNIATDRFSVKDHFIRAKAYFEGGASDFSAVKTFQITDLFYPQADLAEDGIIDIKDWSIFLFRWRSKDPVVKVSADMDGNGALNVADLSVFLEAFRGFRK